MKKHRLFLSAFLLFFQVAKSQPFVYIPDSSLRVILSELDSNLIIGDSMDLANPAIVSTTVLTLLGSTVVNTSGIEHFINLDSIEAQSSSIQTIPAWPPNIRVMYVCCCDIDSLPPFPSTLRRLDVSFNPRITSIPPLPPNMEYLDIQGDSITVLPSLPSTLTLLDAGQNKITAVPPLPPGLTRLYLSNNNIDSLPALPSTLVSLSVSHNPLLSCLPLLPPGLQFLTLSGTAISCLPNHPPAINNSLPNCNSLTSLCLAYPIMTGRTYVDGNGNGLPDSAEGPLRNESLMLLPDSTWFSSDAAGDFITFTEVGGPYTIQPFDPSYYSVTTAPLPTALFSAYGQVDSLNDIGYFPLINVNDLSVSITLIDRIRPGFSHRVKVYYTNEGTLPISNAVLSFVPYLHDSLFSASDSSYVVSGDSIQWSFPLLQPGDLGEITINLKLDTMVTIQDTACYTVVLEPLAGDSTPWTNQYSVCSRIVNSIDPNDKSVSPLEGLTLAQAQAGEPLHYTVRFQNTGTADAVNIEILDTLSSLLDLASFRMLDASHPYSWSLHAGSRVLTVKFPEIHLPDSNTNEPLSHGYFSYRIKTIPGIAGGSQVMNTAAIYFDFNLPVITNTTVTHIISPVSVRDFTTTVGLNIHPNPATTRLVLNCTGGKMARATVFSIAGKLLGETRAAGLPTLDVEIGYLARGMYFIKVETDNGSVLGRFIKE